MQQTGHAFTFLILKDSVANDVINVSLFAYEEISMDLLRLSTPDFERK